MNTRQASWMMMAVVALSFAAGSVQAGVVAVWNMEEAGPFGHGFVSPVVADDSGSGNPLSWWDGGGSLGYTVADVPPANFLRSEYSFGSRSFNAGGSGLEASGVLFSQNSAGAGPTETASFTIEAYFKTSSTSNSQTIVGKRGRFSLNLASGVPQFDVQGVGSISLSAAGDLRDGQWHYLAGSIDAGTLTIRGMVLPDSALLSASGAGGTPATSTGDLWIGGYTWGNGSPFGGLIDEVRYSNTVLADSDLLAALNIVVAPTLTWANGADGNWPAGAWSGGDPGAYPGADNPAIVDTAWTVTVDSSEAAKTLDVSNGGKVSVAAGGMLAVNGLARLDGGTLEIAGGGTATAGTVQALPGATLALASEANLSAASLSLAGGTLSSSGARAMNSAISLAATSTISTPDAADALTLGGSVSGAGGLTKSGDGTLSLNGGTSYSGPTTVNGGTLILGNTDLQETVTVNAGATVQSNAYDRIRDNASVVLNGGTWNLQSHGDWLGPLTLSNEALVDGDRSANQFFITNGNGGSKIVGAGGGNAGTIASRLALASQHGNFGAQTGNRSQEIQVDPDTTLTVAGPIVNCTAFGSQAYVGSLTKSGDGMLILSADNSYTGLTSVNAGTLQVTGSLAVTGTVAVNNGTLTGTGSLGNVTVNSEARLVPGVDGIGALTVNALTLNAGSILDWEIGDTTVLDQVFVGAGGLAIGGGGFNLYQPGTTDPFSAPGIYTLMTYGGLLSGSTANLTVLNAQADRSYLFTASGGSLVLEIGGPTLARLWTGSASGEWNDDANWDGGKPVAGDVLAFAGSQNTVTHNGLAEGTSFRGIVFNEGAAAFTLAGNGIQLDGTINNASDQPQTLSLPLALTGIQNVLGGTGGITLSGPISEAVAGCGLSIAGGVVTLSGTNTFTGTLSLGGTAVAAARDNLGAGTLNLSGGTLKFAAAFDPSTHADDSPRLVLLGPGGGTFDTNGLDVVVANAVDGPGRLNKTGEGTLTLSAVNSHGGGTTLNAGTLSFVDGALGSGNIVFAGNAALQWQPGNVQDVSGKIQPLASGVTATIDTGGNDVSFAASLSGEGGLTKTGDGTLTLVNNSYTGTTTVDGGTLSLTLREGLCGPVVVNAGGSIRLAQSHLLLDTVPMTLNGGIFDLQTFGEYLGTITMNSGSLITGADAASFIFITNGAPVAPCYIQATGTGDAGTIATQLAITSPAGWGPSGGGNRTQVFDILGDAILTVSGTVRDSVPDGQGQQFVGAVSKTGSGTLVLSGNNTYTGSTSVQEGVLLATKPAALPNYLMMGPSVAEGATLAVRAADEFEGWSAWDIEALLVGSSFAAGSNLGIEVTADRFEAPALGGEQGLVKLGAGTLVLAGDNTYGGGTTVNAGTLEIASANALPPGGSLTIGSEGTVVLSSGLSAAAGAVAATAVPEPSSVLLLGIAALCGLAVGYRRCG